MKKLVSAIITILSAVSFLTAQTSMKVLMTTGGDDLRSGNKAFITVHYTNGTSSTEYLLSSGIATNGRTTNTFSLPATISKQSDIKSVVVRHDGSPRAGQPFDTYDNWDLQNIKVIFSVNNIEKACIYEKGTPRVRFTGQKRTEEFKTPCGGEVTLGTSNTIKVYLTTGSDDLRGGNNAYITLHYTDGTTSPEFLLGGGFGQNSLVTKTIDIRKSLTAANQIARVVVRHDGSPRPGQPFDTYDNWDLQVFRATLVMPDRTEQNFVNYRTTPYIVRFTGAVRTREFLYRP